MFTTALRNKIIRQILKKKPHLTSTAYRLLSDRLLWWKERILASCPFRGFQRSYDIVRGQRLYVKANLFIPVMILPRFQPE